MKLKQINFLNFLIYYCVSCIFAKDLKCYSLKFQH